MHGTLKLQAKGGKFYEVMGGPYEKCPAGVIGVKLAPEVLAPAHVHVPIEDFGIPETAEEYERLYQGLRQVLTHMVLGRPIYIGCKGGMGRTGLFLASLAKLWGVRAPIVYVRRHYYAHAVETEEQTVFVLNLQFPDWLRALAWLVKARGWLPGSRALSKVA